MPDDNDDGFRKTYAQERYRRLRAEGLDDEAARLQVTYSYIPEETG